MSDSCTPQLRACSTRVTSLDDAGIPIPGTMYVSEALVLMQFVPDVAAGADWEVRNRSGYVFDSGKVCDVTKRYLVDLVLCTPDPVLSNLLIGGEIFDNSERTFTLRQPDGGSALRAPAHETLRAVDHSALIGHAYPRLNECSNPNGVSIEIWTMRIDQEIQRPAADYPWARWVFPKVHLTLGSRAFGNDILGTQMNGWAVENSSWGTGPMADWPRDSLSAAQWFPVATIPVTACGYAA